MMGDDIGSSCVFVVFVTQRYMDKVAGKGLAVVMEPRCLNFSAWYGKVGDNLGGTLFVNYTQVRSQVTHLMYIYVH